MLEQELASVIRFVIDSAGGPSPYYSETPQDFVVPAVYFPSPEILSMGDTLLTYALEYSWYIKFIDKDAPSAHTMGFAALTALQYRKNVIPLIDETGEYTGRGFRMKDPSLRVVEGTAQLTLTWNSPRPYFAQQYETISSYKVCLTLKSAYQSAIAQFG